jgi:hypothetical protein
MLAAAIGFVREGSATTKASQTDFNSAHVSALVG